jgi:hypothetical protein
MNFDDQHQHEQSRQREIEKSELAAQQAHAIVPPPTLFGLGRSAQVCLAIFSLVLIWGAASYAFDLSRGGWPTTTARISKSWIPDGPRRVDTGMQVAYDYRIGSQDYQGQTFFAPGPELPPLANYSPGMQATAYYNSLWPSMSTISPGSQCRLYVMYMVFAVIMIAITLLVRPDLNAGREMRRQLPEFVDALIKLIEAGVSIPAAFEQANNACASRCPTLSLQLNKCLQNFKISRIPLHQTLAQVGTNYRVEELKSLAATLAAAEVTGSSVAYQLRQQNDSLKYRLKAEQLAERNSVGSYGQVSPGDSTSSWREVSSSRPMTPDEIARELNRDRDNK